jgi:hypothetical protein
MRYICEIDVERSRFAAFFVKNSNFIVGRTNHPVFTVATSASIRFTPLPKACDEKIVSKGKYV